MIQPFQMKRFPSSAQVLFTRDPLTNSVYTQSKSHSILHKGVTFKYLF